MAQRSLLRDLRSPRPWRPASGIVVPFLARPRGIRAVARVAANAFVVVAAVMAAGVAVISVGPRFLPYQVLPVLTGSMEPAIPTGSVAVVVPIRADEIVVGDIVTFHHPNDPRSYVTHRVLAIEDDGVTRTLETKGDANAVPDAWRVVASGGGWRYAFAIPHLGRALLGFEASPLRFAVFALPLLALAALSLIEIWRPRPRRAQPVAQAA